MRFIYYVCICLSILNPFQYTYAVDNIDINIVKTERDWFVKYTTTEPVKQLAFLSSPNSSRGDRWLPLDNNFAIVLENNNEFIRRIDGESFSTATFKLTATYTHLPKAYAPFSPFSDGDMLFHSGRFFVCQVQCNDDENGWSFAIEVPTNEVIIVNGEYFKTQAKWVDYNDGQNVFVGNKTFTESDSFFAIIDTALPQNIQQHLSRYLPALIEFFNLYLPPLKTKPMLFASYSPVEKQGVDSQGGTLPNQVFMHWDGKNISQHINEQSTLWFFGHEIAHLFQHNAFASSPDNAWMHEGGADMLASIAMSQLTDSYDSYIQLRLVKALPNCKSQLSAAENYNNAAKNNSRIHYDCGLALQYLINLDIKAQNSKNSMLNVWHDYVNASSQDASKGNEVELFIHSTKPYISTNLYHKLTANIDNQQFNFYQFFGL